MREYKRKRLHNRGGARPGAGRPKADGAESQRRERVSAAVSADLFDLLNRVAEITGIRRSELVNRAVVAYQRQLELLLLHPGFQR
jgi:hypothetical protein